MFFFTYKVLPPKRFDNRLISNVMEIRWVDDYVHNKITCSFYKGLIVLRTRSSPG